jgi:hypothetical protein
MKTNKKLFLEWEHIIISRLGDNGWDGTRKGAADILYRYAGGLGLFLMFDEHVLQNENKK